MVKKELTEDEFEKLGNSSFDLEKPKEEESKILLDVYDNINFILKKYMDLSDSNYRLVTLWIIGTWLHERFETYPYLFLNAMKGSGKTRLLKIIKSFGMDGDMLNSMTEAVLFRTTGTLCIDEFEGVTRQGKEGVRELLNSCYKKGTKIKRMTKRKVLGQDQQVVEEFEIYRPIAMANIWGMDDVLGDRCLQIILEKSSNKQKTRLVEFWENDVIYVTTLNFLDSLRKCSLCSVVTIKNIYTEWNNYIYNCMYNYTNYNNNNNNNNNTNYIHLFNKIKDLDIDGRFLEIGLPLFLIASLINDEILDEVLKDFINIIKVKKEDNLTENSDISLYDFLSQEQENNNFQYVGELTKKFREFLQTNEDWLNDKWMGRAFKRLNLIIEKKRAGKGVLIKIDYKKANEKIRMFK